VFDENQESIQELQISIRSGGMVYLIFIGKLMGFSQSLSGLLKVAIYLEKPKYRNFADIIEYQNFSRASQSLDMLYRRFQAKENFGFCIRIIAILLLR
jgi:hypothetical protein